MSRQKVEVNGFADMLVKGISLQVVLDEIDRLIDLSIFADAFEASSSASPQGGLMMLKEWVLRIIWSRTFSPTGRALFLKNHFLPSNDQ